MTIYKIRYFINKRKRNGDFDFTAGETKETIVIDNLERAKEIYIRYKNECECVAQYARFSGKCELFIPHQFDNGELAYWADDGNYIEQFEFGG